MILHGLSRVDWPVLLSVSSEMAQTPENLFPIKTLDQLFDEGTLQWEIHVFRC